MATPNLNLDHVTEGQTNKETTANAAFDGLDNAMNTVLEVAVTGNVNLTTAQFRNAYIFVLTGTPGGDFTVTFPGPIARTFAIANLTGDTAFIELEDAASDAQEVAAGATGSFATDGVTFYNLAVGVAGGGGSGGVGSSSITIEEEGVVIAGAGTLNFTGSGVNASENSDGTVDVLIPGQPATAISEQTGDFEITSDMLSGNRIIEVNNASDVFVFLEAGTSGTEPVTIIQTGAGQAVFTDASAVSLRAAGGNKTRTLYSAVSIIPHGSDSFYLVGDLAE